MLWCALAQFPGDVCLGLKSREDFDLGFALEANYLLPSGCLCSVFHRSLQALRSCLVSWDTDSVPRCFQIQDTSISAGLCCIHMLQRHTHASEFPKARGISLVPLERLQRWQPGCWSQWVLAVWGQGCPPCKVPLLACVQLTAVLPYKVDWFLSSLKDIWGTTLLIVTLTKYRKHSSQL